MLRGLGYSRLAPLTLLKNNQSYIEHIETKYHMVREQIQKENILVVKKVLTKDIVVTY